jgi:hypothetical protein
MAFSLLLLQGPVEPRPARARRDRAAHASRRLQVSRHLKKTVLAREMLDAFLACVGPSVPVRVLLDSGGVVRDVVRDLPKNVMFFMAIRISAACYAPLTAPRGVRRKGNSLYGLRLDSFARCVQTHGNSPFEVQGDPGAPVPTRRLASRPPLDLLAPCSRPMACLPRKGPFCRLAPGVFFESASFFAPSRGSPGAGVNGGPRLPPVGSFRIRDINKNKDLDPVQLRGLCAGSGGTTRTG